MHKRISTALIGFGRMAQGYAKDSVMARFYPYATHAQVLRDHPAYDWQMVVDPDPSACRSAREDWHVPIVAQTLEKQGEASRGIEVVVIATPPNDRLNILNRFPNLRAVLVEKPLGVDLASSEHFVRECEGRGVLLQVNLWRRADKSLLALRSGDLTKLVGQAQTVFGVYGNGLSNNGTHMVDMVRMFFGDVRSVQRILALPDFHEGPIRDDVNPGFVLQTKADIGVLMAPLRFGHYRENGLSIWGDRGRLDILNEGLTMMHYPHCENRAMSNEHEIAFDRPTMMKSTVGDALYQMYENLAEALSRNVELCSSGVSALRTTQIIEAIKTAPLSGELCQV